MKGRSWNNTTIPKMRHPTVISKQVGKNLPIPRKRNLVETTGTFSLNDVYPFPAGFHMIIAINKNQYNKKEKQMSPLKTRKTAPTFHLPLAKARRLMNRHDPPEQKNKRLYRRKRRNVHVLCYYLLSTSNGPDYFFLTAMTIKSPSSKFILAKVAPLFITLPI